MDASDYIKAEAQLIELCKDVLMVDMVGLVEAIDARWDRVPQNDVVFHALRRVAVAFLAARGMAEEYRKAYVEKIERERVAWSGGAGKQKTIAGG